MRKSGARPLESVPFWVRVLDEHPETGPPRCIQRE